MKAKLGLCILISLLQTGAMHAVNKEDSLFCENKIRAVLSNAIIENSTYKSLDYWVNSGKVRMFFKLEIDSVGRADLDFFSILDYTDLDTTKKPPGYWDTVSSDDVKSIETPEIKTQFSNAIQNSKHPFPFCFEHPDSEVYGSSPKPSSEPRITYRITMVFPPPLWMRNYEKLELKDSISKLDYVKSQIKLYLK